MGDHISSKKMYTYLLFAALALAPNGSSAKDCGPISKKNVCEKSDGCVWSCKASATRKTCNVDDTIVVGCQTFDKKKFCETKDSNCEWRRASKGSRQKTCNDPATAAPTPVPTVPPTPQPTPSDFEPDTRDNYEWRQQQGCCRGMNQVKTTAGGGDESNLQAVTTTTMPVSTSFLSSGKTGKTGLKAEAEWCFQTCIDYSRQEQLAGLKNDDPNPKYCRGFEISRVKANKKMGRAAQWKCKIYNESLNRQPSRANKSCKRESTMCFPVRRTCDDCIDISIPPTPTPSPSPTQQQPSGDPPDFVHNGNYVTGKGCCVGKPIFTPEITSGATPDEARDECQGLCSKRLKNDRSQPCYSYELRTKNKGQFVCELHDEWTPDPVRRLYSKKCREKTTCSSNGYSNCDTYCDANSYAYCDANSYSNCDTYCDANSYANAHANSSVNHNTMSRDA